MTRPRKQTVDYFPHYCRHGQTMEIIEQEYGLAGYAFWFKLLERLGDTDGHFLDCKNPLTWGFLRTKTRQDEKKAEDILNLLANLDAIDKDLWENEKIIWCQNFVNNIADAYRNRIVDIPNKPEIIRKKSVSSGVSDVRNPKRRGEESKGEESIEASAFSSPKNGYENALESKIIFTCSHFEISDEYLGTLLADFPGLDNGNLTTELKKMRDWLDDNPGRHKRTAKGYLKNPKSFIRNWLNRMTVNPIRGGTPNEPRGFAGIREYLRKGGTSDAN